MYDNLYIQHISRWKKRRIRLLAASHLYPYTRQSDSASIVDLLRLRIVAFELSILTCMIRIVSANRCAKDAKNYQ